MARDKDDWAPSTLAAQALHLIDEATGAVVPGIEPPKDFQPIFIMNDIVSLDGTAGE